MKKPKRMGVVIMFVDSVSHLEQSVYVAKVVLRQSRQ